jgi:hypothetical protein
LYFAHGNISGLDFWGEEIFHKKYYPDEMGLAFGRTVFRKLNKIEGGEAGVIRAEFDLAGPDKRTIGEEIQSYVFRGDKSSRTIDCEFIIIANHGPVTIGDSKEGTFALRVVESLTSPPGHMVNSKGGAGEQEIWGKRADWVDYYGKVAGEDVGIAVFDSPKSFRHPTYWHARAYGLFSANPFGIRDFTGDEQQDGSWTIPDGKSLVLRYRVRIHNGAYKDANLTQAYQEYVEQEHGEQSVGTK